MQFQDVLIVSALITIITSCSQPTTSETSTILDQNLIGTWYHDVTGDGDSPDDKKITFSPNQSFYHSSYVDPDGPGAEPYSWNFIDTTYLWSNGFYYDFSAEAGQNNLIYGNVLVSIESAAPTHLFRYEYSSYPDEITITPGTMSYNGAWVKE